MEDSESRIELVAFLQLYTTWDQRQCFCSVRGKEIQSRFPLRHTKTDTYLRLLGYLHMCLSVRRAVSPEQLDPLHRHCGCARCGVWYLTSVTRGDQVTPQRATTHLSEQCLSTPDHTFPRYMDCPAVGSLKTLTGLPLLRDRQHLPVKLLGLSKEGQSIAIPKQ